MKTKPFDLQAAINGAKLVARDGREAKFIAHVPDAKDYCRVLALMPNGEMCSYYENGRNLSICDTPHDLFIAVQTRSINGHEYPEPEPEVSLYIQCANGMQIPVRSFSEVQMQAYAQAVRDEALEEAAKIAEQRHLTWKQDVAAAIRALKEQS